MKPRRPPLSRRYALSVIEEPSDRFMQFTKTLQSLIELAFIGEGAHTGFESAPLTLPAWPLC